MEGGVVGLGVESGFVAVGLSETVEEVGYGTEVGR